MIHREGIRLGLLPAVLASVLVATEQVPPGEYDLSRRKSVKEPEDHNLGDTNLKIDAANTVLRFGGGKVGPGAEVVGLKGLGVNHACVTHKQQGNSVTHRGYPDRQPVPVKNQCVLIQ
jgi:hypothetical protein